MLLGCFAAHCLADLTICENRADVKGIEVHGFKEFPLADHLQCLSESVTARREMLKRGVEPSEELITINLKQAEYDNLAKEFTEGYDVLKDLAENAEELHYTCVIFTDGCYDTGSLRAADELLEDLQSD